MTEYSLVKEIELENNIFVSAIINNPINEISNIKDLNFINTEENTISINDKVFKYDNIFFNNSITFELNIFHRACKKFIDDCLEGYNSTIIHYGDYKNEIKNQSELNLGNNQYAYFSNQTFDYIFEKIKNDKKSKFCIFMSYVQVYLENIYDLIEPANNNIIVRDYYDSEGRTILEGVHWVKVNSPEDCEKLMLIGKENRKLLKIDDNLLNDVIVFRFEKSSIIARYSGTNNTTKESIKKSKLFLVNLSLEVENIDSNKVERLIIQKQNNYPLQFLKSCFNNSYNKINNINLISYRDTKLTRILQDSLTGNSLISLLVTISPYKINSNLTQSVLNFANSVKNFKTNPTINSFKEVNYKSRYDELQIELDFINREYTNLKIKFDELGFENNSHKEKIFQQKKLINILEGFTSSVNSKAKFEVMGDELKKLEELYEERIRAKDNEYFKILNEQDKILFEQREKKDYLDCENKKIIFEINKLKIYIENVEREKDNLLNKLVYLSNNQLYEEKNEDIPKINFNSINLNSYLINKRENSLPILVDSFQFINTDNSNIEINIKLQSEILSLKTTILKKNKKLGDYEKMIDNGRNIEKELEITKNNLISISTKIKENSSRNNSDKNSSKNYSDKNSTTSSIVTKKNSLGNFGNIPTSGFNNLYKQEYDNKIKFLNETIDKYQIGMRNKQIEIEKSKLVEIKITENLEEINFNYLQLETRFSEKEKELGKVKEFYLSKCENMRTNINDFILFLENINPSIEKIKSFFNFFANENKKNFISDLFERDLDFENLDIFNYNIFLHKVNGLNYIIKQDDQLNFHHMLHNVQINKLEKENSLIYTYNNLMKNFFNLFEILINTLIKENSKIFYYTNNINKLMKINLLDKYEILALQKKIETRENILKRRSLSNLSELNCQNTDSTNDNYDDSNEATINSINVNN